MALEHFLDQIIGNITIVAGKRVEKGLRVTASQRKRGHLQADDPALCAALEQPDLIRAERQVHGGIKKDGSFIRAEAKISSPDFQHLPAGAPAGKGKRRILTCQDHQMEGLWLMIQEEIQAGMNIGGLDEVIVIQHQCKWGSQNHQLVNDRGKDNFHCRGCRRAQCL